MRVLLGVAMASGLAAGASAQDIMVNQPSVYSTAEAPASMPGTGADMRTSPLDSNVGGLSGYEEQMLLLKRATERLTRQDGGQLTPKHAASLQRYQIFLNRQYGKDRPERLASF